MRGGKGREGTRKEEEEVEEKLYQKAQESKLSQPMEKGADTSYQDFLCSSSLAVTFWLFKTFKCVKGNSHAGRPAQEGQRQPY